jgi:hypothetical protein
MQAGKDLGPLRNLPRSPLVSQIKKAALDSKQPFHYALGAFTKHQIMAWAKAYWHDRIGKKHPFQTWKNASGVFPLWPGHIASDEVRMSITGDWGTGTDEANQVALRMQQSHPHFTIHLGDVYYVGDESEILENFLGVPDPNHNFIPCTFPHGSVGTLALSGNHEMYARGFAYFDTLLPKMGVGGQVQEASYFCLENDNWRVIALDTAYNSIGIPLLENILSPSCGLTTEQLQWLENVVKPSKDLRGIILLTHHQYYSAFEEPYFKAAEQLAEFINRPVLWFWGHEHRMAVYDEYSIGSGIRAFGRCIGHGGMPIEIGSKIIDGSVPLIFHDDRRYPSAENITVGYNGHVNLTFCKNHVLVEYVDLSGKVLLTEQWTTDAGVLSRTI